MKIWSLLLLIFTFSSNAYSFIGEKILRDHASQLKKQNLTSPHSSPQSCTDFSGTWNGTCTGLDGLSHSDTMKIEQWECDEIFVNDSTNYLISGFNDKVEGNSSYTYQQKIMMGWNEDATKIEYVISGNGTTFGQRQYNLLNGTGSFTLVNDELSVVTKVESSTVYAGNKITKQGTIRCTYQRGP